MIALASLMQAQPLDVDTVRGVSLVLFFFGFLLYFAPAIAGRKKANARAIFWLNFLLGWTLVGWVVALVWALTVEQKPAQVIVNQTPTAAVLCSSCGKYSPTGASFCPLCGAAITGSCAKSDRPAAAN